MGFLMETEEEIRILREFHENVVAADELCFNNTEYQRKIIAVCDRKVVASGLTDIELERNIPQEYRERPDLFTTYIRKPGEWQILMNKSAPKACA